MAHILAVDDDPDLCTLLKTALERDGHAVEIRTSGVTVTESLCRWADCILLDVMMPGEDGFATCRRIRAITQAPILFLTARTDEQSVLTGLGIGADDYLTKPFRVAELRARVAAHLRRQNRAPASRMVRGGIGFDLAAKTAMVGEQPLPFTRSDPKLARAHASAGVEGDLPSPVNPKPGCRFCGRCPYAKPICSEQTPAMKEAAPGHFVACHLY